MAAQEPASGEKWQAEKEWRKKEYLATERDLQLKRDENAILEKEFGLKDKLSHGWKWWTPMLLTAVLSIIGWAVSVYAIVYTISSTIGIENKKRADQLEDDQRKDVLAASLEHRQALVKAISLVHDMTKHFVLNSQAPSKAMFEAYLPKLQDSYFEITGAHQKLYVLEPKVAAELDKPFRQLDDIVDKLSTFYTSPGYSPETLPFRWTLLNCQLEEIQANTTFDKVMPFLRRPGSSVVLPQPTARKGAPRDCDAYSRHYLKYKEDNAANKAGRPTP